MKKTAGIGHITSFVSYPQETAITIEQYLNSWTELAPIEVRNLD
ncbi:hypothetical protein [Virgibacillus siamensis]